MTHARTSAFWRLFSRVRFQRRDTTPKDPSLDVVNDLPQGLTDSQLRDIGLSDQQSYLYRAKDRYPQGF
ncbi:MAG: hypothetical protein ACRBB0_18945 [Pelagimonas sp.]|uniref:hypothetical protein n=1 Tax=Pelagimonas sp. TaxID=2073170 RepID=UPI003D6BE662